MNFWSHTIHDWNEIVPPVTYGDAIGTDKCVISGLQILEARRAGVALRHARGERAGEAPEVRRGGAEIVPPTEHLVRAVNAAGFSKTRTSTRRRSTCSRGRCSSRTSKRTTFRCSTGSSTCSCATGSRSCWPAEHESVEHRHGRSLRVRVAGQAAKGSVPGRASTGSAW